MTKKQLQERVQFLESEVQRLNILVAQLASRPIAVLPAPPLPQPVPMDAPYWQPRFVEPEHTYIGDPPYSEWPKVICGANLS